MPQSAEFQTYFISIDCDFSAGETTHSLVRAAELRQKIALGFQAMDTVSKKIVSLKPEEEKPSERDQKLRLSIRAFAVSYVQECSAILPKLPNEKEYQQLIAQRDEERKRRVERELKEAQVIFSYCVQYKLNHWQHSIFYDVIG